MNDVCGSVGNATNMNPSYGGGATDPVGLTPTGVGGVTGPTGAMIAYNDWTGVTTGSGGGQKAQSCRVNMFDGTDLPYGDTDLENLDGAPGLEVGAGGASLCSGSNGLVAPYGPQGLGTTGVTGDASAPVMSFPITGGAVAIAINLNGVCTTVPTQTIDLTSLEFNDIMQGTINKWNDTHLTNTNPILATDGCTGTIQRVVRQDKSGTTAITMTDLNGVNTISNSGTALCDTEFGSSWAAVSTFGGTNINWPKGCTDSLGNPAPNAISATTSGSPALIGVLDTTNGGIGYAELGLWPSPLPSGVQFAALETENATQTAGYGTDSGLPSTDFQPAGPTGGASNCTIGENGLPGTGSAAAVGLQAFANPVFNTANWASDATTNVENVTYNANSGNSYPVCGLTWDFVYSKINNGNIAPPTGATGGTLAVNAADPVQGLNYDQLHTLYSFYTYVFSPAGQEGASVSGGPNYSLNHNSYDQLPGAWLDLLRQGFQNNF
jgi:hypothetical protein